MPTPISIKEYCNHISPGFSAAHKDNGAKRAVKKNYWLELLDPKHRNAMYLRNHFEKWRHLPETTRGDFYDWVDSIETANGRPAHHIQYLPNPEDRAEFKTKIEPHAGRGNCVFITDLAADPTGRTMKLLDTTRFGIKGKSQGYAAYAVTTNGNLYINASRQKNCFSHASFNGGEKVLCAGMLRVEQGKITDINNVSGHYRPGMLNLFAGLRYISHTAFKTNKKGEFTGTVSYGRCRFPDWSEKCLNSSWRFIRFIGTCLAGIREKTKIEGRNSFLSYAHKELQRAGIPLPSHEHPSHSVVLQPVRADNSYSAVGSSLGVGGPSSVVVPADAASSSSAQVAARALSVSGGSHQLLFVPQQTAASMMSATAAKVLPAVQALSEVSASPAPAAVADGAGGTHRLRYHQDFY